MKPKARTEREVTRDIVAYMQACGYTAIRCIAGPVRNMRGGERYAPQMGNPAGFPDWCFIHPAPKITEAGTLFIEVKAPGKRPTKLQMAWLERLQRDGFKTSWCDGFRGEGKKPFLDGQHER